MDENTILVDIIDRTIPIQNNRLIPVVNKPNPVYGEPVTADQLKQLIQLSGLYIYEAGTKKTINGTNFYDYFPEENPGGGGGSGGGVTKAEVQAMINKSKPVVDSVVSTTSKNAIENGAMTNFVNSSIATNTANYIGLFDSIEELNTYTGTITNNDYAFVVGTDEAGNTKYVRYKYSDSTDTWLEEYTLNNSSYTAEEWAAIQSGIKSGDVEQINTNKTNIENLQTDKADRSELVGKNVTGTEYTINDVTYTAGEGAEIFNDYTNNKAIKKYSHAEGTDTMALGFASHAEGLQTKASFDISHAEGKQTTASGLASHAEGEVTTASGFRSHAEGEGTIASSDSSHAEGYKTTASGNYSHAEGNGTTAEGDYTHAEGYGTKATAHNSHAEGRETTSSGLYSHAECEGSTASGRSSHAEGDNSLSAGGASHAEGKRSTAYGEYSHVEGFLNTTSTNAESAHAEGMNTQATNKYSHSEGYQTTASGEASHAEGGGTTASGARSHAEGGGSTASGDNSHAEGYGKALGNDSHAEGINTTASGEASHAEGTSTNATGTNSHTEGGGTTASGAQSHAEGGGTTASGDYSHSEGTSTGALGRGSHAEGTNVDDTIISGAQTADGPKAYAIGSHAEGIGTVAGNSTDATIGYGSHSEGYLTKATVSGSHSEGIKTTASGYGSHAEGDTTTSSGLSSHSEGYLTKATSAYSHAEGYCTQTTKSCTHAEGSNTIAASNYQHVQGKYNVKDSESKYAFIIGNGTSDTERSNAFAVDWDGLIYVNNESTGVNVATLATDIETLKTSKANTSDVYTKTETDVKVADIKSDIAINRTTLGTSCKNLLKNTAVTKTISGITFTVNTDGSVTANGTNSTSNYVNIVVFQGELEVGEYILSGTPVNDNICRMRLGLGTADGYGTYLGVDSGNGYTFTVTEKAIYTVLCQIANGKTADNITFYPMLRYSDIIDSTYEPYKENIDKRIINNTSDIAINKTTLGTQCKNLCNVTYTTRKAHTVNITVNSDKSLSLLTDSATSVVCVELLTPLIRLYANVTYILTGAVNSTIRFDLRDSSKANILAYDSGSGVEYTPDSDIDVYVCLRIEKSTSITSSVTVYPMLRVQGTDDTYEPYKENIDERVTNNTSDIAINKTTLGTSCKNLLKITSPPKNANGIAFALSDGVITLTGTATKTFDDYFPEYPYSTAESNTWIRIKEKSVFSIYGTLNTVSLAYYKPNTSTVTYATVSNNNAIVLEKGSIIIGIYIRINADVDYTGKNLSIMLRYADIQDDTYEAYVPSLQEQIEENTNNISALNTAIYLYNVPVDGGAVEFTEGYVMRIGNQVHINCKLAFLKDYNHTYWTLFHLPFAVKTPDEVRYRIDCIQKDSTTKWIYVDNKGSAFSCGDVMFVKGDTIEVKNLILDMYVE